MKALSGQHGEPVGTAGNEDITVPEFSAEVELAPPSEPGVAYYLVLMTYIRSSGHWRLISVRYDAQEVD